MKKKILAAFAAVSTVVLMAQTTNPNPDPSRMTVNISPAQVQAVLTDMGITNIAATNVIWVRIKCAPGYAARASIFAR